MAAFSPLLDVLADVPDPRRGQGMKYKLPHVLLFSSSPSGPAATCAAPSSAAEANVAL